MEDEDEAVELAAAVFEHGEGQEFFEHEMHTSLRNYLQVASGLFPGRFGTVYGR
jgi:hypothetical protein